MKTTPFICVCSADEQMRDLICINLSRRGYAVSDLFPYLPEAADPPLSLIIFDLGSAHTIPVLTNYLQKGDKTPIILLVNRAPSTGQMKSLMPIRWLEKPLAIDLLMEMVREIIG